MRCSEEKFKLLTYLGANQIIQSLLLEEENVFNRPDHHFDHKIASVVYGYQHPDHQNPSPCLKVAVEILQASSYR